MIKLIKHDMKEIKNVFIILILYAIFMIYNLTIRPTEDVLFYQGAFGFYGMLFILNIFNAIFLYSSTFSNRGYLTFKLGINRRTIIRSKLITILLINIIAILWGMFISYLLVVNKTSVEIHSFFFTLLPIIVLLSILSKIVTVYLAMAIGNAANTNNNIPAILAYFVIDFAEEILKFFISFQPIIAIDNFKFKEAYNIFANTENFLHPEYQTLFMFQALYILTLIFIKKYILFHYIEKKLEF